MIYKERLNKYICTYGSACLTSYDRFRNDTRIIYAYSWKDAYAQAEFQMKQEGSDYIRIESLVAYDASTLVDADNEKEVNERFINYSRLYQRLVKFFNVDVSKIETWLSTDNPLFGNVSPYKMMQARRTNEMVKIAMRELDANNPI